VLKDRIKAIFLEHKSRYESSRIKICLAKEGLQASRRRITLKCQGLYAKGQIRYRKPKAASHTSANLVNQHSKRNKRIKYGDISYIPTQEGTLYVSVFLDSYTREYVGYAIRNHIRESLVLDSLQVAIDKHQPKTGLIVHTDNGSQYTGSAFIEMTRNNEYITSNSRKGTRMIRR
jgi:putative transposase